MAYRIRRILLGTLAAWLLVVPVTGTAQTPSARPVAEGDGWQITGVQDLPGDWLGEVLSPDGRWVAFYRSGGEFCFWEVATRDVTCSRQSLPDGFLLDPYGDAFVWAPDSTAVAIALPSLSGRDSDIYLVEIADARMVNLTEDHYEGGVLPVFRDRLAVPIDDTPAWSPDSQQIAFSRTRQDAGEMRESIMRVNRSGGEPVEIIPLGLLWPMEITTPMTWLPDDTLLYTQMDILTPDDPRNGLWQGMPSGAGGEPAARPRQLVLGTPDGEVPYPVIESVNLERGLVSLYSVDRALEMDDPSAQSGAVSWLLEVEEGALTPLPDLDIDGRAAGLAVQVVLSPDGRNALITYAVGERPYPVMMEIETGVFQLLDHSSAEPFYLFSPWAENDTVLGSGQGTGLTVLHLERTTEATPAG